MSKEKIRLKIRPSRIGFLDNYVLSAILWGAYGGFFFFTQELNIWITLLVASASVILIMETELYLASKKWHITDGQIFFIDGLINVNRSGVFLSTLTNVEVKQSSLDRLLNVGHIEIHGFQKAGPVKIPGVRYPEQIAGQIENMIQTNINQRPNQRD